MILAVNYSPQAASLLKQGRITFDRFKCPEWPDLMAEAKAEHSIYVHFGLIAGTDIIKPDSNVGGVRHSDWAFVERMLAESDTPYVNIHLAPTVDDFPGVAVDTTRAADVETVTRRLVADITLATARFGPERVIVENIPYWGTLDGGVRARFIRPAVEPTVITRVVAETGCGLLLDLAHASITAHTLGIDVQDYIGSLPTYRLMEMHITGLTLEEGRLMDHHPLTASDWALTEWAMAQIRSGAWAAPWAVAFEYGGVGPRFAPRSRADVLAAQVPRLYALAQMATPPAPTDFTDQQAEAH